MAASCSLNVMHATVPTQTSFDRCASSFTRSISSTSPSRRGQVRCRADASVASAREVEGLGQLRRRIESLSSRLDSALAIVDLAATRARIGFLENESTQDDFWNDSARAQSLLAEAGGLKQQVQEVDCYSAKLDDARFALELLEAEASSSGSGSSGEGEPEILREALEGLQQLEAQLERWELRRLLSGPHDARDARVSITAGAGGVDAMDWTAMLERMYSRWAADAGYALQIVDRSLGEEAGVKSVELEIRGRYAYGYLRGERGTHRLVRNSPFNAKGARQTSFAGVEVLPILQQEGQEGSGGNVGPLEIPDRELEVSFMRSSGAGGQNVNKVETGVRLTHLPTGISVRCTQARTQEQNRSIALQMLQAKLLVVMEEQQAQQLAEIRGDAVKADWGQQIRNYVFQPYKMVKDVRTGAETADVQGVMDGKLDMFVRAYLQLKAEQARSQEDTDRMQR